MAKRGVRQMWKAKLEGKSTGSSAAAAFVRPKFSGVILGIDPSLRGTGLAVVEFKGSRQPVLLRSETVKQKPSIPMAKCLGNIGAAVANILDTYEIDATAVEQTIYVQNFQTAQILGAAKGAAIAAAAMHDIAVFEYPPLRVKQAVVGIGRASKEQVAKTVKSLMGHGELLAFDEADAAAVAITHAYTGTFDSG